MFTFSLFGKFSDLVCGISTRSMGDMRIKGYRTSFFQEQNIDFSRAISLNQVHGASIVHVGESDIGKKKHYADGLVTEEKNIFLSVLTADCVPIFFYESKIGICGIVHAGWKGTLKGISGAMIEKIVKLGGRVEKIIVGIGPHIADCCYSITKKRKKQFERIFGEDERMIIEKDGKYYLDLAYTNMSQIIKRGIDRKHIDAPICCTGCQSDLFFSFRKGSKESFGEMMNVIGMRK